MKYKDLRDFIDLLEKKGELKRITQEIDPYLEMTEIADRTLRAKGPALLFENPKGHSMPLIKISAFNQHNKAKLTVGENYGLRYVDSIIF